MAENVVSTPLSFLGEEPLSYGYGGTGKASTDCKFTDFGQTFTAGDIITAYLVRKAVFFEHNIFTST